MPEKPKREKQTGKHAGKKSKKPRPGVVPNDEAPVLPNEQEKSYYYDDAHGYEIYKPEEDDDDEI